MRINPFTRGLKAAALLENVFLGVFDFARLARPLRTLGFATCFGFGGGLGRSTGFGRGAGGFFLGAAAGDATGAC